MSRRVMLIGGSILGALAVLVIVVAAVAGVRRGEVLPGVSVEDVDLGGLGPADARQELQRLADERLGEAVVLTHDGQEFTVEPAEVGADVDVDAMLTAALSAGRDGSFLQDQVAALRGTDVRLELEVEVDDEAVRARIEDIAAAVDTDPFPGDVSVDPVTLEIDTRDPEPGVATQQDEAVDAVEAALDAPGAETLELPTERIQPETDASDVEAVAATARNAVETELVLTSEDGELVLAPREVAALLSTEQTGQGSEARLRLTVTEAAVDEVVVPLAEPLLREPRNASYDVPRSPPVTFDDQGDTSWSPVAVDASVEPGRTGTEVEPGLAAPALARAVRAGEREVSLPLGEYPAEFSTEEAQEQAPTHLLSTFTTYHACCQTRVANIQRLADLVDDTLVLPGEQFSINQISGVRECSKGFQPAGMILDGEIVDSCGGGVSQFGTTTVNAVFFAGLDPDAYKPHSFYISRYPMAREATLNYPSPDLDVRFTNDTGSPIVVRTSYTSTSITVSFYGRSDVVEVRADVGSPTNYSSSSTERRVNRDLPPGASRVVQSGRSGFYVSLTRTVVREGGATTTDDWSNTYVPVRQIIEYNPAQPQPEPEPEPPPEPDPEPEEPAPTESATEA